MSKLISSAKFIRGVNYNVIARRKSCASTSDETEQSKKAEKSTDEKKTGLVLGVYETKKGFVLTPASEEINHKSGGKICKHLNDLSCEMKMGKAHIVHDLLPEYTAVALSSFGPKDAGYNKLEELDEARENIRWGVGAGVQSLAARGCDVVQVDTATAPDAAAEAAYLAAWRFQEFKACASREVSPAVSAYGTNVDPKLWNVGSVYGVAQNWARYLSDMPANKMTPVGLAQAALDMLCPLGVHIEAHNRTWIEAQKMEAFLTVARGSCEEPIFVECVYDGAGKQSPVLLAAKGVTFDSGGLCLKKPQSMVENRGSMAGAAVVLAALKIVAELKLPINVRAVIPLCENMISGQCMKVGDVVRALNGVSIQIECTDMEGRLMLADALVYGQAKYRPSLVIDVATLTHGILLATGGGAFGCFSNSDVVWKHMQHAGALVGDRPWRLPLWRYYHRQIDNDPSVDLRNQGCGKATPCIGAAFLRNFVCGDWLHMDITGVGKLSHALAPPYLTARRMSGRPARTLAALLAHISRADADKNTACN